MSHPVFVGTAGWSLPRASRDAFPAEGAALRRYAARLGAAEINSSFYRPHRATTYRGWAEATPDGFRFSVKAPRELTHVRALAEPEAPLARFLDEVANLGPRLGPVLVQLPPRLAFDPAVAGRFFDAWRARFEGALACEPRHPGWFGPEADGLLSSRKVARVAADPACVPAAADPGGWDGLRYHRLHGSPRMYSSSYGPERLRPLAGRLVAEAASAETWCVFDNTMHGAAIENALAVQGMAQGGGS
jgi:uncharacterized protein YecE (DUF72 family)